MKTIFEKVLDKAANAASALSSALGTGKKLYAMRIETLYRNPGLCSHVFEPQSQKNKLLVLVSNLDESEIKVTLNTVGAKQLREAIDQYLELATDGE